MKKRVLSALLCMTMALGLFAGCGAKTDDTADTETKKKIVMGGPQQFMDYISFLPEVMGEMGYEVEFKIFDDVVAPDTALAEGSIDANFYQHKPYLEAFNEANGTELVACEPHIMASYDSLISKKYKTVDEIEDGAKVAIANDESNLSANLCTLEHLGLIKLADIPEGSYYTLFDVKENPKNLEFVEVQLNTQWVVLDDVDFAVTFYSGNAAKKYECNVMTVVEDAEVKFPVIVAVDGKNKDAQWVKDLMTAMTGEEMTAVLDGLNSTYKTWRILY